MPTFGPRRKDEVTELGFASVLVSTGTIAAEIT
jgi:hypothetical protein